MKRASEITLNDVIEGWTVVEAVPGWKEWTDPDGTEREEYELNEVVLLTLEREGREDLVAIRRTWFRADEEVPVDNLMGWRDHD